MNPTQPGKSKNAFPLLTNKGLGRVHFATRTCNSRRFGLATRIAVALALFGLLASAASAQVVGNVATVVKTAEIGRGGEWTAALAGSEIMMGDTLRTGDPGSLKIILRDESALLLSAGSELVVNEYVFRSDDGSVGSLFDLLKGKLRSVVSEYYEVSGKFDVTTGTAIAGVRGTDFIVSYDDVNEVTEVVGISGTVFVRSLSLATAAPVLITAQTQTTVEQGRPPTEPRALGEERFEYYLDGVDFVTTGMPANLKFNEPILSGQKVGAPEGASASAPAAEGIDLDTIEAGSTLPNASGLAQEPPVAVDAGDVGVRF
jgi:hypothetical protein